MDTNNFCLADGCGKSTSETSLLSLHKMDIKILNKNETELDKDDSFFNILLSDESIDKSAPKSSDTMFEIPDMPSSAGSSYCRSPTSSVCSTDSSTLMEDLELELSDQVCDVRSSTLTLVSQSYAPSDSTSPALHCSVPDNNLLVILDSATAILQLPKSVPLLTETSPKRDTNTGDHSVKLKASSIPIGRSLLKASKSVGSSDGNLMESITVMDSELQKKQVDPMKDPSRNKSSHQTTVPMYLVEMLPGQFMAFPTHMPGPLGPIPATVPSHTEPHLQYMPDPNCYEKMMPQLQRWTQPIPLYHSVIDSESGKNEMNSQCTCQQDTQNVVNNNKQHNTQTEIKDKIDNT